MRVTFECSEQNADERTEAVQAALAPVVAGVIEVGSGRDSGWIEIEMLDYRGEAVAQVKSAVAEVGFPVTVEVE